MCNIIETLPGDTLLQEQYKRWMVQGLSGPAMSSMLKILIGKFVIHIKIYPMKLVHQMLVFFVELYSYMGDLVSLDHLRSTTTVRLPQYQNLYKNYATICDIH